MIVRSFRLNECRVQIDDHNPKIEGYAAVFNSWSQDLGGFVERVRPAAFDQTLAATPDTRALQNHDPNFILGRTRSGTLRLSADSGGLHVEILPPTTQYARDLMIVMERGDIDEMSFAFRALDDEWYMEGQQLRRDLNEVSIDNGDVSVVTFPAYQQTSVQVRSLAVARFRLLTANRKNEAALVNGVIQQLQNEQRQVARLANDSPEVDRTNALWQGQPLMMRRRLELAAIN